MSNAEGTRRSLQEWAKLALIPALVLVLAAIFYGRLRKSAAIPEPIALVAMPNVATTPVSQLPETNRTWPHASLEEVISFNPFDPPPAPVPVPVVEPTVTEAARPGVRSVAELPAEKQLETGELQAVFRDARGIAALVGSRVIRIGDRLENGRRVVEITPQEIVTESK